MQDVTQDTATIAGEAFDWFETRTRDDDTTYTTLKDGRPDWVQDAVREAHCGMLPDVDRIYRLCRDTFMFIHGNDATEDDQSEFAEQAVDVYTMNRLRWLASHLSRPGLCDEAADEFGGGYDDASITDRIGWGQYLEASRVYAAIWTAVEARSGDIEDES